MDSQLRNYEVIQLKLRDGPTGIVKDIEFSTSLTKFSEKTQHPVP